MVWLPSPPTPPPPVLPQPPEPYYSQSDQGPAEASQMTPPQYSKQKPRETKIRTSELFYDSSQGVSLIISGHKPIVLVIIHGGVECYLLLSQAAASPD